MKKLSVTYFFKQTPREVNICSMGEENSSFCGTHKYADVLVTELLYSLYSEPNKMNPQLHINYL
jgi:hypothetical protein